MYLLSSFSSPYLVAASLLLLACATCEAKIEDFHMPICPEFVCQDDMVPVPKTPMDYFESTGCEGIGAGGVSMMGGSVNKEISDALAPCCDVYHSCFQICGTTKQFCNHNLETCMVDQCNTFTDADSKKKCEAEIEMKKLMLQMIQCREFYAGQRKGCKCVHAKDVEAKRKLSIRSFYKQYSPDDIDKADALGAKATNKHKHAGLIFKLVQKYPSGIKKIKDPKQKKMEDLMKNFSGEGSEATEKEEEVDEKIEL